MISHFALNYIDPGTGSMLFTIIIGVVSAGIYALRGAVLKLRFLLSGGKREATDGAALPIAVFVDDKRYWNVFGPVCEEFERRGEALAYLTASADDPALEREFEHVTCDFVGEDNAAFARMNMLKADVVVSTTPGLDVYQWKRSRDVKRYVHVPHAVSDLTLYRMFGIDFYDSILLTGEFQGKQVRALEKERSLPAKELAVVGSTYMDELAARRQAAGASAGGGVTVLLAPSWGASSIFNLYGGRVIEALLATDYHIVVRPHPQSFASEADLVERLMAQFPESNRLEWNRDNDNFDVLMRSDIMVSDFSGVIWDFALAFDRPVIYTEPRLDLAPYDACWLDEKPWTLTALPKVGAELTEDNVGELGGLIAECLEDERFREGREQLRMECWSCRGEAAVRTADYLIDLKRQVEGDGPDGARGDQAST